MAYVLIPDGYSLKQVTKLQKQAVNEKRRHDDVVTFLSNPNTPLLIGGAGLLALTPILMNIFRQTLADQGTILTDEQMDLLKKAFQANLILNPVTGPIILGREVGKKLTELDLSKLEEMILGKLA